MKLLQQKYNTGVLYLPWSYDLTQIILFALYLLSFQYSHKTWKFHFLGLSSGELFECISHCK